MWIIPASNHTYNIYGTICQTAKHSQMPTEHWSRPYCGPHNVSVFKGLEKWVSPEHFEIKWEMNIKT